MVLKTTPDALLATVVELQDMSAAANDLLLRFKEIMNKHRQQIDGLDEQYKLEDACVYIEDFINWCNAYSNNLGNTVKAYSKAENELVEQFSKLSEHLL